MLSVQQCWASYVTGGRYPQSVCATFSAPNTAGNGLIVLGLNLCQSAPNADMGLSDAVGNVYTSLGLVRVTLGTPLWTLAMRAWYCPACLGGVDWEGSPMQNTLWGWPLNSAVDYPAAIFGFEYPGALGTPNGELFQSGVSPANLALSLPSAYGLAFSFGAQFGQGTVSLDAGSTGYTTEQSVSQVSSSAYAPQDDLASLAIDQQVSSGASAQFDFTQTGTGLAVAVLASFPWPATPAPPPQGGPGGSAGSGPSRPLSLQGIPGFFDLADDCLQGGQPCADDFLLKISHNAKFAAVRSKLIYMGFYGHGNTVPAPVDPDDGYTYAREECQFVYNLFSNRSPAPGFVPGQAGPPAQSNSQPGTLYNWPGAFDVNDATGQVSCQCSYWQNGQEVFSNDGILKVYAVCRRLSLNSAN